jgi:hypothetical protein
MRLIAFAVFALVITTSAQAMPVAPVHEPDGIITQVAYGCGAGRTRVGGVCVARTTKRQVRRCVRWSGGVNGPPALRAFSRPLREVKRTRQLRCEMSAHGQSGHSFPLPLSS